MLAVLCSDHTTVDYLVSRGVCLCVSTQEGKITPIHMAALKDPSSLLSLLEKAEVCVCVCVCVCV